MSWGKANLFTILRSVEANALALQETLFPSYESVCLCSLWVIFLAKLFRRRTSMILFLVLKKFTKQVS